MPRTLFAAGLLLSFLVAAPACKKDEMAKEATSELDSLADEMVETILSADDKKQGVADAHKLLDAKKADLGPKMAEIRGLSDSQLTEDAAGEVMSSLAGSALKVESLKVKLLSDTVNDPELGAAITKLTGEFANIVTE